MTFVGQAYCSARIEVSDEAADLLQVAASIRTLR